MKDKIIKFLNAIFAPKTTIYYNSQEYNPKDFPQDEWDKVWKLHEESFDKMDEAFKQMDKVFNSLKKK